MNIYRRSDIVIEESKLPSEITKFAVDMVFTGIEKQKKADEISSGLVSVFNSKYGKRWMCLIGTDYIAAISYEQEMMLRFSIGPHNIILYRVSDDYTQFKEWKK
ncbi:hypothetical protein GJ496_007442 [Pomphorhynchus laevis]|nr:hypothetical protein GJ496_007442 [Pomphorhynchus laevis]